MYLDHRITVKIARILDMVDMSALLLDSSGNVILPEGDPRVLRMPEELLQNPTMPFVYGGVTLIGTAEEQSVFVCLHGDSEDVKKCAVLCAELINMMLRESMGQTSREQALRLMLRGEVDGAEFESLAAEHDLPLQKNRCVLYFYFQDLGVESAMQLMSSVTTDGDDLIAEVGHHAVAMLKAVEEENGVEEIEEFARAFEVSLLTESGATVVIGISDPRVSLSETPQAFEEARTAINVGRVYHAGEHVFVYRKLLLERFLSDVSPEIGADYNGCIFNRGTARLFNDEMVHTIETFFENSLNLSETARKLYIHRNTLVYRLEKVQHAIGLDLRNFDDAVTFKMMMLLGKGGGNRRNRL